MNRLHLFELEDQPWLPRVWRDGATDALNVLFATLAMYRAAAPVLVALMHKTGTRAWFDLCSGAGGGALAMRERLIAGGNDPSALTLSDRYPHAAAQQRVRSLNDATVRYHAESIDACRVSAHPPAIRTMFGALHHFAPETVRGILHDAVTARAPVAFVDVAGSPLTRRLPVVMAPVLAVPNLLVLFVAALLLVPMVRPFRWSRLLWTYLLPAIPLLFAWDGTVSALRAYTPEELLAVAASVPDGERYEWASAWAGQALYLTGHERAATVGMMSSEGGPS